MSRRTLMPRSAAAVLIGLICFLLQGNAVQYLSVKGGVPDLLLIMVFAYTMLDDLPAGFAAAVVFGFLQDICYGRIVGSSALVYLALGFLMIFLRERVYISNKIVLFLMTALVTFLYTAAQWGLYVLLTGANLNFMHVTETLPGAILWNFIILLIVSIITERRRRRERFMF